MTIDVIKFSLELFWNGFLELNQYLGSGSFKPWGLQF